MTKCSECGSQKVIGFIVTVSHPGRGNPDIFEFRCKDHLYTEHFEREREGQEALDKMNRDYEEEKTSGVTEMLDDMGKILGYALILNMEIDGNKCYYIPDDIGGIFPVVIINIPKKTIEIRKQGGKYRGGAKKIAKKYGFEMI